MARPLRIDVANTWYHVMNRGHRGQALFLNDTDRRRFLGAVAELPERYGLEVHAFVLMENHYHLLVRTGEIANLSQAVRWLNVSYAVQFNWAHRCRGTVFQGRFKAVLIQEESKAVEVARYIHLNPVRIGGLGLSKSDQRRARVVGCEKPKEELIRRRLQVLREHQWNSWRVYSGAEPKPGWVEASVIGTHCGGKTRAERIAALTAYTEGPIRQGGLASPWEGLKGGIVLGDQSWARRLLTGRKVNREEQTSVRRMASRVTWEELVNAAEKARKDPWEKWAERHGDWGRDGVIYVAIRHGGLRVREVAERAGLRYQAAAQAARRFEKKLPKDRERQAFIAKLKRQMSNI